MDPIGNKPKAAWQRPCLMVWKYGCLPWMGRDGGENSWSIWRYLSTRKTTDQSKKVWRGSRSHAAVVKLARMDARSREHGSCLPVSQTRIKFGVWRFPWGRLGLWKEDFLAHIGWHPPPKFRNTDLSSGV